MPRRTQDARTPVGRGGGMADRPVAAEPVDETPLVRRFRLYSVSVVVLGVLAALLVSWWLPPPTHTNLVWTGVLLTAGSLVAEQLAINFDVRSFFFRYIPSPEI